MRENLPSQSKKTKLFPFISGHLPLDLYDFDYKPASKLIKLKNTLSNKISTYLAYEEAYDRRFFFAVFSAALGALVYFYVNLTPSWTLITALLSFTLLNLYLSFKDGDIYKLYLFFYFLSFFALGLFFAKFEDWRMSQPMLTRPIITLLQGQILSLNKDKKGQYSAIIAVKKTEKPELDIPLKRIRAKISKMRRIPKLNDHIEGYIQLVPLAGPAYPDGYDFAFANYFKGISAQGFFLSYIELRAARAPKAFWPNFFNQIEKLRSIIDKKIKTSLANEEGAIASALITGKREGISDGTLNAYRLAGLAHLLAISGLHMALISFIVLSLIRQVLVLIPYGYLYYPIKQIAAGLAIIPITFYLFIAGASISATRSYIMMLALLLIIASNRSSFNMRHLILSLLLIISYQPSQLLMPAFQMSYGAAGAIIAISNFMGQYYERKEYYLAQMVFFGSNVIKRLLAPVISIIIASLIAGLVSGFFSAYHFFNIAPLSIASNVLALPIVTILIMPALTMAVVLMAFNLEDFPLYLAAQGLRWVKLIAYKIVAITPEISLTIFPAHYLLLITIGLALIILLRSPLRLLGLPFLCSAVIAYAWQKPTLLIISENRKQIASLEQKNLITTNKARFNKRAKTNLTLQNWQQAFAKAKIINAIEGELIFIDKKHFYCEQFYCVKALNNGHYFIILDLPEAVKELDLGLYQKKALFLLNYSTHRRKLREDLAPFKPLLILTRRDLARKGTALIYKDYSIKWSLSNSKRNWNSYRLYNEAAYGF